MRGKALTPHGFTLMEILVVLVIAGIISAVAVLSISSAGPGRLLQQEAERMAALVALQCEEAVLRGTGYAVSFGIGGSAYGFMRLAGEHWIPRQGDTYRPRELPDGFHASLRVEGRPVTLDEFNAGRPHLVCLASGEAVPFEVRLHAPGTDTIWLVTGDWNAEVEIKPLS